MKKIALGITGSIAIYKVCELIRRLKQEDIDVICIMTESAKKLINPILFEYLSENKVIDELFARREDFHVRLAEDVDLLCIVPATYNIINKIASGVADDFLSTFCACFHKKRLIAPAMDKEMWENPILQENIQRLKNLGYIFIGPTEGKLLSGKFATGRLAPIDQIFWRIKLELFSSSELKGKKILLTLGATREYVDKVRFISNESSGKMGYYLAYSLLKRGAQVEIVKAYCSFSIPLDFKEFNVISSEDMLQILKERMEYADVLIFNAAVCDFKPHESFFEKKAPKKNLLIVPTDDIIKTLLPNKGKRIFIGFCAEDRENLLNKAAKELKEKQLDATVANPIDYIGKDENEVWIITKDKSVYLKKAHKEQIAEDIIEFLYSNGLL